MCPRCRMYFDGVWCCKNSGGITAGWTQLRLVYYLLPISASASELLLRHQSIRVRPLLIWCLFDWVLCVKYKHICKSPTCNDDFAILTQRRNTETDTSECQGNFGQTIGMSTKMKCWLSLSIFKKYIYIKYKWSITISMQNSSWCRMDVHEIIECSQIYLVVWLLRFYKCVIICPFGERESAMWNTTASNLCDRMKWQYSV